MFIGELEDLRVMVSIPTINHAQSSEANFYLKLALLMQQF